MATTGFREPSLVFLTQTALEMTDAAEAADFLAAAPCRLAFVEARGEAAFLARLGSRADVQLAGRRAGYNLNGGRALDIGIYVRQ